MSRKLAVAALCLIAAGALVGCSGSASIEAEQPYQPGPSRKFAYEIVGLSTANQAVMDDWLRRRLAASGALGASGASTHEIRITVESYALPFEPKEYFDTVSSGASIQSRSVVSESSSGAVVAIFRVSTTPGMRHARAVLEGHADQIADYLLGIER